MKDIELNNENTISQSRIVENYLKDGNRINQMECIDKWGFTRLSALMFIIRDRLMENNENYRVKSAWEKGINRFGRLTKWKNYWLEEIPAV